MLRGGAAGACGAGSADGVVCRCFCTLTFVGVASRRVGG